MAHLFVESADGTHRVELVVGDNSPTAYCAQHPNFALYESSRYTLNDAFEEAQQHVDEH